MKTIIVTARKEKKDKNQKNMAILEISTPSTVFAPNAEGIKTALKQKPQSIGGVTGWEESYLPSLKGKPDFEYTLEEGEEYVGDIVTRNVTDLKGKRVFIADGEGQKNAGPDKKDGKTGRFVDTMRVAVFANSEDESAFEIEVARSFKRKGYLIVDKTKQQALVMNETPVDVELVDNTPSAKVEEVATAEAAQAETAS
jgi:hypothetical protein